MQGGDGDAPLQENIDDSGAHFAGDGAPAAGLTPEPESEFKGPFLKAGEERIGLRRGEDQLVLFGNFGQSSGDEGGVHAGFGIDHNVDVPRGIEMRPVDQSLGNEFGVRNDSVRAVTGTDGGSTNADALHGTFDGADGDNVANLSATQAIQLAAALNGLRGGSGGLNPMGKLQGASGLDRIGIVGGDEDTGRGTSLAVGQHISNNIYVEVVTDSKGFTATQLEVALSKTLSILSKTGTNAGSSAALRYSRDY